MFGAGRVALKIALLIFIAESVVMFILPLLNLPDIPWLLALADAAALTVMVGPAIYLWVISPYAKARDASEEQLQSALGAADRAAKIADEATRDAKLADQAKSDFLSAMSHELRTPLNAVIGFSEMIKSQVFGPVGSGKYKEYATDISDAGTHLLDLINDILDLSKVEAGNEDIVEELVDIEKLLDSVLTLVKGRATQREVKLSVDVQEDLPYLRADPRKLKQILVNLMTNAIKFNDRGGEVVLKTWHSTDGFVFQITDTGIGIAAEDIPKALSRFGQVDRQITRSQEGTGLGLPLTKALVELHGGSLDLQSSLGEGTTVTVRFPLMRTIQR